MPFVRSSVRFLFIIALMVSSSLMVFSSPDEVLAQGGDDLVELVTTENELVSVRVPTGWWFYDNSGDPDLPLFSTMLVFGDVEDAIYTRIDYNHGDITSSGVVGRGGEIILLDEALYQQTFGSTPSVEGLIDILMGSYQGGGAEILEGPQTFSDLNGQALIIRDGTLQSIVIAMDMNGTIVLASLEAEQSVFEANIELFSEMIYTVASPAEQESVVDNSNDGSVSGGSLGATLPIEIRSADDRMSINLPEGWAGYVSPNPETQGVGINIEMYIGSSQEAVDIFAGLAPGTVSGVGGILLVTNEDTQNNTIDQLWDVSLSDTDGIFPTNIQTGEINGHPARWGEVADFAPGSNGYWIVVAFPDNNALVAFILSNDGQWETQRPVIESVFKSIQYDPNGLPPTDDGTVDVTENDGSGRAGGTLGGLGGGTASAPELTQTLINAEGTLEVSLPPEWLTFVDPNPVDADVRLVFANNQDMLDAFPNASSGEQGVGGIMLLLEIDVGAMTLDDIFQATLAESTLTMGTPETGVINGLDAQWGEYTVGVSSGYWIVFNLDGAVLLMNVRNDVGGEWENQRELAEMIFKSVRYDADGLDTDDGNEGQLGELGQ